MKNKGFICNSCKKRFRVPSTYQERHQLDTPPYESVDICPYCGSADFFEFDFFTEKQEVAACILPAIACFNRCINSIKDMYGENACIAEMIKQKGFAKERIRADCAEPKSNADLRRLGISRIMPSVKGRDSVLHGIAQIQEYKIYVHPKCVNTLKELSSYCWKKDKNENGHIEPQDNNNHLMDAMRYAFCDVRYFNPIDPKAPKRKPTQAEYYIKNHGLSPTDIGFK